MLRADALTKVYGDGERRLARQLAQQKPVDKDELAHRGTVIALHPVSFQVEAGQALAVMGPAGSGKSTLLKLMAGAEVPSFGSLWLDKKNLAQLSVGGRRALRRRQTRLVGSSDRLFPHLTLRENLLLAARLAAAPSPVRRVSALLSRLGLQGLEGRYPAELTTSQQRKALLAQALTGEPKLLLLDGLADGLPAGEREALFALLKRLRAELNLILVISTEDAGVAFAVGDLLTILGAGEVLQTGTTLDVILDPKSEAVRQQLAGVELGDVMTVRELMQAVPTVRLGSAVSESAVSAIVDGGFRYGTVLDENLAFVGLVTPQALRSAMQAGGNLREVIVYPQKIAPGAKVRSARRHLLEQEHALAVIAEDGSYLGLIDRQDVNKLP